MKHSIIVFFLFASICFGQKSKERKITVEDLKQTAHQIDTSAVAAIIDKRSTVKYIYDKSNGFHIVQDIEYVYKIYKKQGLKYADFEIPYYIGYKEINKDRVNIAIAETYNLVDNKIVKSVVKKESTFKTKQNEYWEVLKLSFPNVREGSIFKIKYQLKTFDIGELPDYHFQYSIPVDYAELRTYIPEFYIYKTTQTGMRTINTDSKMSNGSQSFEDEYNRTASFSFKQIDSYFYLEDVPALKNEPLIDNLENYRTTLFHELEVIRMPDQDVKKVSMTWEDVGQSIKSDNVFKDIFSTEKSFENHLGVLLNDTMSKEEMMHKIFRNVQMYSNWNGNYGIYKLKTPVEIFNNKTGSISEINSLLIKMLREKEINAYPLLISTVNNGVAVFPTKRKFNAFITAVDFDGKIYLMDPSDKFSSINVLPARNLNWDGQMVRHDHRVEKISLTPKLKSNKNLNIQYQIENGSVKGKLRNSYTNHQAYKYLRENDKSHAETNLERLDNQYQSFEIKNLVIDQSEVNNKFTVTETFDFDADQSVDVISNKTMVNPFLGLANFLNPFTSEERKLPIYFGHAQQLRFQATISINETMSVEHLPESISININGDLLSFVYRLTQSQGKINASITLDINQAIYNSGNYDEIKEFFTRMTAKMKEKIILVNK
jgi:hypothetical protein